MNETIAVPVDCRRSTKPLLLVDFDGVLNSWNGHIDEYGWGVAGWRRAQVVDGDQTKEWCYRPIFRKWLTRLSDRFEMLWCTGRDETAPQLFGPQLGAADWPVVSTCGPGNDDLWFGTRMWKLPVIDFYLASRGNPPAAILDDEADAPARAWASARPTPTLIMAPRRGLAWRHVRTLERWADGAICEFPSEIGSGPILAPPGGVSQ